MILFTLLEILEKSPCDGRKETSNCSSVVSVPSRSDLPNHREYNNTPAMDAIEIYTSRSQIPRRNPSAIEIDETFIQRKLRTKDKCLTEIVLSQDLTDDELKRFNYCRTFVGAIYLSEICKAEGSVLVPGISKGDTSNTEYKTSLRKPRQQKPDKKSWKVWTKVLSYITKGSNTLKNDLRKWTEAHIDAGTWKSYYSTDNNRVMRFENDL